MHDGVSRRGVYRDLTISPYRFTTPYGDIFRFSSAKKLEIYSRDIDKELARLDKLLDRHDLRDFLPRGAVISLQKTVYLAFYRKIEG